MNVSNRPDPIMTTTSTCPAAAPISPAPARLVLRKQVADSRIAAALRFVTCGLAMALGFMAGPRSAHAAPPELMTYQGFLVDANGNPLAPSTPAQYPVIFRIFTAPINGTRLWSEQQIVTVDKGNFSVILGEGTPIGGEARPSFSSVMAGPNNVDRYMSLSVTIGSTTTEMLPRLRLLPAPYAFSATSANNLVNPGGTSVVTYANSRVEVNGNFNASGVISGNGSGLTGLTLSQLPPLNASSINLGTLPDAQLSLNVARRDVGNTFNGYQSVAGNVGIGTVGSAFPLTIGNNILGDKISLWGQSGNSFGFGIAPGLLQIHTDSPGSDIAFGFGSSGAMGETVRIKGNGNVGVGTPQPSARLSLVAPGASEIQGSVRSETLLTSSGSLGTAVNSELTLASFGFNSANNSSLGIRAIRATAGGAWETAAVGLGMDVDNTVRVGGSGLWFNGNGNVGVGTTTPTAKLEVNGAIKANSLTVNGPVSATAFTGTFNGEKPPQSYTVAGNTGQWRDVLVDGAALLGDADGGRIKILLRNVASREVRTLSYEFYCENDSDNFGQATRYGWSVSSYGGQRAFRLGSGTFNDRYDIAADWDWYWLRNYRTGAAVGGVDGPAFGPADRYKFYMTVPPNITATVILYDR